MVTERDHLLTCVPEKFDLAEVTFPLVDKQGCAMVKTNAYLGRPFNRRIPFRMKQKLEERQPYYVWQEVRRLGLRRHPP